ncbi:hypothetical protein L198_06237 [Cryptococcus wingfieldii CBS 7118]|uniref:AA1-like domain-containing protein n=1 Tax=Cryptococcus wingfieldii CBS 7118 TaxID=1295528 RepID=A0A1E3INP1_9TREE|nr:hypothetical protein L198_06237 [Cryptococcus wingfieldii CBS 7118]ODN90219.1 hypothetical protein L198_06237 [Cryptococcus wingfieldii CBS 7118]
MLVQYLLAILSLPAFTFAFPTTKSISERATFSDVMFTSTFPEQIVPGSTTLNLAWEGGDGRYEGVYHIGVSWSSYHPREVLLSGAFSGTLDCCLAWGSFSPSCVYQPGFIFHNTTETSVTWTLNSPTYGTFLQTRRCVGGNSRFGVADVNNNVDAEHWYQLVGPIPVDED